MAMSPVSVAQTDSAGSGGCLRLPLLSPVESLQPPGKISLHMSGMCFFSSREPVALNQAVPRDFLNNLLNKNQQPESAPPVFRKYFVSSREHKGMRVIPPSFSPCTGRVTVLFLAVRGNCWLTFLRGPRGSGER